MFVTKKRLLSVNVLQILTETWTTKYLSRQAGLAEKTSTSSVVDSNHSYPAKKTERFPTPVLTFLKDYSSYKSCNISLTITRTCPACYWRSHIKAVEFVKFWKLRDGGYQRRSFSNRTFLLHMTNLENSTPTSIDIESLQYEVGQLPGAFVPLHQLKGYLDPIMKRHHVNQSDVSK